MLTQFILLSIGSYLLGSVPAAYLTVRWSRGADIRKLGTGNVGAANVLTTASKRLAIPVVIFDIGKGALCVWVAQLIGLGAAQQITMGILSIAGHNWSVFLRFRGGRGILATAGVVTMLSPKLGLIAMVLSFALVPVRRLALGVFLALISLPLFSWFLSRPLDIDDRLPVTLGFVVIAVIGLGKRLIAPRSELSKTVPLGRLIITRLFLDRDIADRKAWINRGPRGQPGD